MGKCQQPYLAIFLDNEIQLTTDLVISFFCISEQTVEVVDKYIRMCIVNAKMGYLQLNFNVDIGYDIMKQCKAQGTGMYIALELFMKMHKVQPTALVLPPCAAYDNVNIVWGRTMQCKILCRNSNL